MLEFNIAPNTQIGRIIIPEQVYDHENAYKIEEGKYSRGGEFIENMVTDNIIEFSHRWFKLPTIEEFIQDINEFYNSFCNYGSFSNLIGAGFVESPIIPIVDKVETPIIFDMNRAENPIMFFNNRPVLN